MTVHDVDDVPMMNLSNVLMYDKFEAEWRIGHCRIVFEGVDPFFCACSVQEANDLLSDDEPVPVFTNVTHWARLPSNPGEAA